MMTSFRDQWGKMRALCCCAILVWTCGEGSQPSPAQHGTGKNSDRKPCLQHFQHVIADGMSFTTLQNQPLFSHFRHQQVTYSTQFSWYTKSVLRFWQGARDVVQSLRALHAFPEDPDLASIHVGWHKTASNSRRGPYAFFRLLAGE